MPAKALKSRVSAVFVHFLFMIVTRGDILKIRF